MNEIWSEINTCLNVKNEQDMIINKHMSSCKVLIIVQFKWDLDFLDRVLKSTQILNFMKIHSDGAEYFHAERRTDRHDEANSSISQFCEHA